jgi:hypothetical protein
MIYNNNTYITLLTANAIALGMSEHKRKSNDGLLTILEFHENETIPQNVLNVVINTMTHQQALGLVDTNEWKSNSTMI